MRSYFLDPRTPLAICSMMLLQSCAESTPIESVVMIEGARIGCASQPLINTYIVELYGVNSLPEGRACGACGNVMGACELVSRRCRCGGTTAFGGDEVSSSLSGVRFDDLAPEATYCLRVLALEDPDALGGPAAAQDCACDAELLKADRLMETVRVCGLSSPVVLGTTGTAFPLLGTVCADRPLLFRMCRFGISL